MALTWTRAPDIERQPSPQQFKQVLPQPLSLQNIPLGQSADALHAGKPQWQKMFWAHITSPSVVVISKQPKKPGTKVQSPVAQGVAPVHGAGQCGDGIVVDVEIVEDVVVGWGVPAADAALVMLWMTGDAHTSPPATAAFLMRSRLESSIRPPIPSKAILVCALHRVKGSLKPVTGRATRPNCRSALPDRAICAASRSPRSE